MILLGLAALPIAGSGSAGPQSAADLFQRALMLERAEGRVADAVFLYERVIAEFPRDRAVVPQALYQLALAYEQRRDPRARVMLARLVSEFPGATPLAADARRKLTALQGGAAGSPFKTVTIDEGLESGSPDGRLAVYYQNDDTKRLFLRDLGSGAERLLVDSQGMIGNFAWSPDSARLAFNFQLATEKIHEIRIVTIATGEVRRLPVRGYPVAWTAANEIFFYLTALSRGLVNWSFVPADGGEPRLAYAATVDEVCCRVGATDGSRLVLSRGGRLLVRDLATGAEQRVTTGSGEEDAIVVSPDFRLVAFRSNEDGEWALYVAPLDRLPATPVRLGAAGDRSLRVRSAWWTRAGVLTYRPQQRESNVYRLNMDPRTGRAVGRPIRLTQDATENWIPVISPDSRRIAYWFRNGGRVGLAVMDSDGTGERPLFDRQVILQVAWRSPDEILIYDAPRAPGQRSGISAIDVRTGALQRLAEIEGLYWAWLPSRNEILHFYPGGGGPRPGGVLKAYSLTDGRDRVVATVDYLAPKIAVSQDGRRLAYVSVRMEDPSRCELAILSLVDGVKEKTLNTPDQPCLGPGAWSPDGRFLIATGDPFRVLELSTGQSWPLHPDVGASGWDLRSWAPDGSFVALSRTFTSLDRFSWAGVTYEAVTRLTKSGQIH